MDSSYRYESTDSGSGEEPDYYIALLPDEPECEIGLLWRAISPTERERIVQKNTKRKGTTDWTAFVKELSLRCVKGIKGLTPQQVKEHGILLLSDAALARAEADHSKRGWSETPFSRDLVEQLATESDIFRRQVVEFSTEVEAVDEARKVWLGKASRTGRSGGASAATT